MAGELDYNNNAESVPGRRVRSQRPRHLQPVQAAHGKHDDGQPKPRTRAGHGADGHQLRREDPEPRADVPGDGARLVGSAAGAPAGAGRSDAADERGVRRGGGAAAADGDDAAAALAAGAAGDAGAGVADGAAVRADAAAGGGGAVEGGGGDGGRLRPGHAHLRGRAGQHPQQLLLHAPGHDERPRPPIPELPVPPLPQTHPERRPGHRGQGNPRDQTRHRRPRQGLVRGRGRPRVQPCLSGPCAGGGQAAGVGGGGEGAGGAGEQLAGAAGELRAGVREPGGVREDAGGEVHERAERDELRPLGGLAGQHRPRGAARARPAQDRLRLQPQQPLPRRRLPQEARPRLRQPGQQQPGHPRAVGAPAAEHGGRGVVARAGTHPAGERPGPDVHPLLHQLPQALPRQPRLPPQPRRLLHQRPRRGQGHELPQALDHAQPQVPRRGHRQHHPRRDGQPAHLQGRGNQAHQRAAHPRVRRRRQAQPQRPRAALRPRHPLLHQARVRGVHRPLQPRPQPRPHQLPPHEQGRRHARPPRARRRGHPVLPPRPRHPPQLRPRLGQPRHRPRLQERVPRRRQLLPQRPLLPPRRQAHLDLPPHRLPLHAALRPHRTDRTAEPARLPRVRRHQPQRPPPPRNHLRPHHPLPHPQPRRAGLARRVHQQVIHHQHQNTQTPCLKTPDHSPAYRQQYSYITDRSSP